MYHQHNSHRANLGRCVVGTDATLRHSHAPSDADDPQADGVDSTTLGLIAKLGIHCQSEYGINVQLFCESPSILRTLDCMGFDEIIDIFQDVPEISADLQAIEPVDTEVDEMRRQVLEAHKLLVKLSPDSQEQFTDLIRALESGN